MTREEAIKHLKDIRSDMWTVDSEVDAINMAIEVLEQPEVIRCGECAYRCKNWISTNEDGDVIHHCRQLDQMVEDDFYCGCAERKEG